MISPVWHSRRSGSAASADGHGGLERAERASTMSLYRLLAVIRKEFRHIGRDWRTFFLVTAGPVLLLITLSYVFALDVSHVHVAVQDLDRTPLSRALVAALTADGDLVIVAYVAHTDESGRLFARDQADLVLTIPRGFGAAVSRGEAVHVGCIVDGADAVTARQTLHSVESRISAFVVGRGARADATTPGIAVHTRVWYNGALQSLVSMVPGMLSVILCMPVLALALSLTREKETGSFEALIATPVRGAEYLLGKLLAYEASGLVSAALTWLVATLWFRVPFRGSLLVFMLLAADFLLAGMGIALLLANRVRSQQTVTFLILTLLFVPSFFISGLLIPVTDEPLMRMVAEALPPTHFIAISRSVFLKGQGLAELWQPALVLLATGLGCVALGLALFRREIA